MNTGLDQRVAFVTGSSRGIGSAIARSFAREGARVAVTYRNNRDQAEAVADAIRAANGEALVIFFDLASDDSIRDAANRILGEWGRIDVLVNNAVQWATRTMSDAPPFERLPPAEWREALRPNIEGAYAAMQAVLPSMRERRWGRIVNISAVIARDGMRGAGWYATAKSALHGLTRSLAREVGSDGILVNVVMPGPTLTEAVIKNRSEAVLEPYVRASPIARLLQPEEIASTVVFLCSAANTAITGEIIRASGGLILPHRP